MLPGRTRLPVAAALAAGITPSAPQDDNAPPPQLVIVLNWIEELTRTAAGLGR